MNDKVYTLKLVKVHLDGDDMDCVSHDIFGMYEMGIDMSWVLA